jgi:ComF family protein
MELLGKKFKKYLNYSLNLIYPLKCLICQKDIEPTGPRGLCADCFNKIQKYPSSLKTLPEHKYYFKQSWATCPYEGIIKEAIQLLKYKGKLILVNQLSSLMIAYAQENLPLTDIDFIIPVPLHRSRLKEREFNQSEILASKLGQHYNLPCLNKALIKIRPTPPQTNLSKEERLISLKGAFALKKKALIKRKNILLIDDVFTTGATVNQCAKVLIENKAAEVSVFTLAKG